MNNRIVQDTFRIFLITAISGLLLGAVYVITKEPIKNAEIAAKQAAYKEVFTDSSSFNEIDLDLNAANEMLKENGFDSETFNNIVCAIDDSGNTLGYVFNVTTSAGYRGDISFSVGIQNDGTINGYSILSISETAGLGMKAADEEFKSQFENKAVNEFKVTKSGASTENEIDAISGATVTSKAMTAGVNACIFYLPELLEMEGGATNE